MVANIYIFVSITISTINIDIRGYLEGAATAGGGWICSAVDVIVIRGKGMADRAPNPKGAKELGTQERMGTGGIRWRRRRIRYVRERGR